MSNSINKFLITKRKHDGQCRNELTKEMDEYLVDEIKELTYCGSTYIYDSPRTLSNGRIGYGLRFPGATRGSIELDDNMVIQKIWLYRDEYGTDKIYKKGIDEIFEKYIGMKLVFK
ncbi:hypothetical protein ACV3UL_16250 [Clostridium perfringens]